MQLIVDIPETVFNAVSTVTTTAEIDSISKQTIMQAFESISQSTQIPAHDSLIDRSDLIKSLMDGASYSFDSPESALGFALHRVYAAPTIIEGDDCMLCD